LVDWYHLRRVRYGTALRRLGYWQRAALQRRFVERGTTMTQSGAVHASRLIDGDLA
jgi:hypothetical protein